MRPACLLVSLFLMTSCDLSKQEDPGTGTTDTVNGPPQDLQDDVDEQPGLGREPPEIPNSNDPLVQQMYLQALSCGYLSKSTVPATWDNAMVTSSGCSVWKPANWPTGGKVDQFQIFDSTMALAGWFVTTGQAPGTTWTLQSAADSAYQSIAATYGNTPKQHYIKEYELFGVKAADLVFSFNNRDQPSAAFMRVFLTEPNYILGTTSLTFMGFFMAQSQMSIHMCNLMQIDASLQCPAGGGHGCWDSDCNSACQSDGYSGGSCVGDECQCQ